MITICHIIGDVPLCNDECQDAIAERARPAGLCQFAEITASHKRRVSYARSITVDEGHTFYEQSNSIMQC